MGADRLVYLGVVGNTLKVHGTLNLRIADASIMCVQCWSNATFFAVSISM